MAFGISQIKNHNPKWVKITFAIVILLTTAATFLIASEPRIPNGLKVEIGVYIKTFEIIVFGLSKMFGIEIDKQEAQVAPENNIENK